MWDNGWLLFDCFKQISEKNNTFEHLYVKDREKKCTFSLVKYILSSMV